MDRQENPFQQPSPPDHQPGPPDGHTSGVPTPRSPETVEETGLEGQFLLRFLLKSVYVTNLETAPELAEYVHLPELVVSQVLEEAKEKRLVEVLGLADARYSTYRYALTGLGRDWAIEALAQSQYTGPAPVSMEAYRAQVAAQPIRGDHVTPESIQSSLSHLVLSDSMLARRGPAANSGRAVLLHGAPGNGKTSIALALGQAFDQAIWIPHCLEVDGQVIRMFDPSVHEEWPEPFESADPDELPDARWVRCRRPVVVTGGELTIEMLDLSFDPISKFYEAPAHVKAMGGVFIADDLGRQRVQALDLINRWIMPLERRVDFLTLHTGKKVELPFDQLVVFSTNSAPQSLIDAAGLRRLPYKFHVQPPTADQYLEILRKVCEERSVEFEHEALFYLLDEFYPKTGITISAAHPAFLVDHILERCAFEGKEPRVTLDYMHDAVENLLVDGSSPPIPSARAGGS